MIADLQRANAELRRELSERAAALARRDSDYDERLAHQAATVDVLQAMSASPGDPQPVFDLIVRHATDLCNGINTALFEFDGHLVHFGTNYGGIFDAAAFTTYRAMFPMEPTRGSITCRAILDREVVHIADTDQDGELHPAIMALGRRSQLSVPLLRDGKAIGAIPLGGNPGGFSNSQIALLQTFAEQAVIAITGAETYRALQTRTAGLQESLEYQTAISDVLKVISRSTFDLQPVLAMVAEAAARLCAADQAALFRHEGSKLQLAANWGFPPEYEARMNGLWSLPVGEDAQTVSHRTILERNVVRIPDVAAVPGYPDAPIKLGRQRTSLGVPLLREGEPIGLILLARQRVEPFTERQIELVRTFADQALIAIENTRLLTEQREALERQTATAEVLGVINANPGDLGPVFDAILEKAHDLCGVAVGAFFLYHDGHIRAVAARGYSVEREALFRQSRPPNAYHQRLIHDDRLYQIPDLLAINPADDRGVARDVAKGANARTALLLPIREDGVLLGFISAFRPEVQPFSDKEIALLENFAAQTVIAMENARLMTETRKALEQQTATADVLQVINASPGDLTPVFDALLEKALRLCEAAFGSLATYDGAYFHAVAMRGVAPGYAASLNRPFPPLPSRDRPVGCW